MMEHYVTDGKEVSNHLTRPSSSLPCGICKDIFTSPNLPAGKSDGKATIKRSITEWKASAALGCPICWWILYSPSCHQTFEWTFEQTQHIMPGVESLSFDIHTVMQLFTIYGPLEAPQGSTNLFVFRTMAEEGNPAARISKRRPAVTANSDQTFDMAKKWLEACKTHDSCTGIRTKFFPKRLLELSDNSESNIIHLRECSSMEAPGEYATLSYCWGDAGKQVLTTRDKLTTFVENGLELSSLPSTIRDAIKVVRLFNIKFVWIDALCILQDDDADKARELPHMGDIFRNSEITISAATSRSVDEGFLDNSEVWSGHNLAAIWLPWRDNNDSNANWHESMPTGRIGLYHNIMADLHIHDAIDDRAWTFQETLLSRRLLAFSAQGVYYTCVGMSQSHIHSNGGNETAIGILKRPLLLSPRDEKAPRGGGWDDVVAEYSRRSMSVAVDKLPALSGVAAMYGTAENWLAGLWRNRLPSDFLWKPAKGHLGAKRQSEWRAPTWSWMSLDDPVQMSDRSMKYIKDATEVEVVQASITPLHEFDKFGRIQGACLQLKGHLRLLLFDQKERTLLLPAPNGSESTGSRVGFAELDCLEDSKQQGDLLRVVCLYVGMAEETDKLTGKRVGNVGVGLLLQHAEHDTYSRIGTFRSFQHNRTLFCPRFIELVEYEPSPNFDLTPYLWPGTKDQSNTPQRHYGVRCQGPWCKAGEDHEEITGIRYHCYDCKADYCGRCKGDVKEHPLTFDGEVVRWHRCVRLRMAVKKEMLKAKDWQMEAVKVEAIEFGNCHQAPTIVTLV